MTWLQNCKGAIERLFGGEGDGPPVDPLFQLAWDELEDALRGSKVLVYGDIWAVPNVAEIFFEAQEWEERVRPHGAAIERALEQVAIDTRRRLDWPREEALAIYYLPADPDQQVLPRGAVRVRCSRTGDPALLGAALRSRVLTSFGLARPAATSSAAAGADTGGGAPPAGPGGMRVRAAWRDRDGDRVELVDRTSTFGREAPGNGVDLALRPLPEGTDPDAWVVSRRAVAVEVDPHRGCASVRNLGRQPLTWLAHGQSLVLEPEAVAPLGDVVDLLWPPAGAGPGFRLHLEVPGIGILRLARGARAQQVSLVAPLTRVVADPRLFGPGAPAFDVDASRIADGNLLLNPEGDVEVEYGGHVGHAGSKLLWPVGGGPVRAGDLQVEIRVERP